MSIPPTVDEVYIADLKNVLRALLATIGLHADCMDNRIDRAALDPYIEIAEDLLGETIEDLIT